MRPLLTAALLGVSAAAAFSCSDEKVDKKVPYEVVNDHVRGCVQGVVYDGVNKSRVDLGSASMYVVTAAGVVQDLRRANALPALNARQTIDLTGEYILCGVPFGGTAMPLYLHVDGYQDLSDTLTPPNRTPDRGNTQDTPGFWVQPTMLRDITVFRLTDLLTNDFTVTVLRRGVVVPGARVILAPASARDRARNATTDANGIATFPAADLAFGTTYEVDVYDPHPDVDGAHGKYGKVGTVVIGTPIGITGAIVADTTFSLTAELGNDNEAPVLVTSRPENTVDAAGAAIFVFDREVLPDSSTLHAARVVISDYGIKADGTPCTQAAVGEVAPTPPAAQIAVAASGRIITITPAWATAPSVAAGCHGMKITYTWNGLQFISKSSTTATPATLPGTYSVFLTTPGP